MQKLIKINNTYNCSVEEANKLLAKGWKVIQMIPIAQPVAVTGSYYSAEKGNYGALLLLEKD